MTGRWSSWLVVALVGCAGPASPAPQRCESCHADVAREQAASFHHVAFSDATYQRSLALEAQKEHAFCNGCHAPDGRDDGVGCVSCHGAAHTAKAKVASASCGTCHQFAFNDGRPDLVQRTIAEHDASPFASVPCTQCHMERGRRKSHVFEAGHSLAWLRGSLKVTASRRGERAHVEIQPWTGHAFPTGDMFRRARLLVTAESDDGRILATEERIFGRTWGSDVNGLRRELGDTRIRGRYEEDFELRSPEPIARIRYSVVFERVLAQRAGEVTLVSSDEIAGGEAR